MGADVCACVYASTQLQRGSMVAHQECLHKLRASLTVCEAWLCVNISFFHSTPREHAPSSDVEQSGSQRHLTVQLITTTNYPPFPFCNASLLAAHPFSPATVVQTVSSKCSNPFPNAKSSQPLFSYKFTRGETLHVPGTTRRLYILVTCFRENRET
jgi:hypothetical protein